MARFDWFNTIFAIVTTFAILGFVVVFVAFAYTIIDSVKHPCIKYKQEPCEVQECVSRGYNDHCLEWRTYPGTCPVCVEQKP